MVGCCWGGGGGYNIEHINTYRDAGEGLDLTEGRGAIGGPPLEKLLVKNTLVIQLFFFTVYKVYC